jgi:tetratricopeptide (TPR) repeat protein
MEVASEFEPEMALGLYYLYERQGETQKAITVLDEATTTHLGFLQALGYLGQQYARNAQNHDALRVFTTFKARVPKSPWAALKRAEALAHIGNQDQALVETQEVVARSPDSVAALTALASRQIDAAKYEDARATIVRAMKLAPDHPALLTRLSYIALESGQIQEALELAQKAVVIIGDGRGEQLAGYAHLDLGHALARLGRTDEALSALARAKELGVDADDLLVFWRDAKLKDFMNDARNPFRPLAPPEQAPH